MVVFLHFWKVSVDKRGFCRALALYAESFLLPCSQFLCRRPSVSLYLPAYLFPAAYLAVAALCWKRARTLSQSTVWQTKTADGQQNRTSLRIPLLHRPQLPGKTARQSNREDKWRRIRRWKRRTRWQLGLTNSIHETCASSAPWKQKVSSSSLPISFSFPSSTVRSEVTVGYRTAALELAGGFQSHSRTLHEDGCFCYSYATPLPVM